MDDSGFSNELRGLERRLLRDYFAASALMGLLINRSKTETAPLDDPQGVVKTAYEFADAMLLVRESQQ
jgi:hypothetical protein